MKEMKRTRKKIEHKLGDLSSLPPCTWCPVGNSFIPSPDLTYHLCMLLAPCANLEHTSKSWTLVIRVAPCNVCTSKHQRRQLRPLGFDYLPTYLGTYLRDQQLPDYLE